MLRTLALHLAALAIPLTMASPRAAASEPQYRISGPLTHDNLSVYLVHGRSAEGPVPLTLQEALARGAVVVHETGTVSRLEVENTSGEEVFIQAGDIVKGGQQDRVLTVSLMLAPKSGRMPIGAYCVEQGRWAARGKEDVKRFSSADKAIPSREAKMALLGMYTKPEPPAAAGLRREALGSPSGRLHAAGAPPQAQGPDALEDRERILREAQANRQAEQRVMPGASAQGEVWASVAKTQRKLSDNLQAAVAAPQSASSLQLSLENQKLAEARAGYVARLSDAGAKDADVVGFVVAINGKLSSAELYPSNGLFRKMWSKQLDAAATEAIGEKSAKAGEPPAPEAALAFLAEAEKGKAKTADIDARLMREARDAEKSLLVETRRRDGTIVHRSYLAK